MHFDWQGQQLPVSTNEWYKKLQNKIKPGLWPEHLNKTARIKLLFAQGMGKLT